MNSKRRAKAVSRLARRLVVSTAMPSKRSSRCSRYAVSRLALRSWASRASVRRPNSASASSNSSSERARSATSNTAARFFSVSPIHFDTRLARSTTSRSTPSACAMASAASVLPVPGAPQNSSRTPRRPPRPCAKPQSSSTVICCATRRTAACSCAPAAAGTSSCAQPACGATRCMPGRACHGVRWRMQAPTSSSDSGVCDSAWRSPRSRTTSRASSGSMG